VFRWQRLVVYPIYTQGAFFHHLVRLVKLPTTIRAGPRAELTAYAIVVIDKHYAVLFSLVAGTGGANGHTGGILTMQARLGKMENLRIWKVSHLVGHNAVIPNTLRVSAVRFKVR
jgi:hypothetical protein